MASSVLSVASYTISPSASLWVHDSHNKVPLSHTSHVSVNRYAFYDFIYVLDFQQGKLKFGSNGLRFSTEGINTFSNSRVSLVCIGN